MLNERWVVSAGWSPSEQARGEAQSAPRSASTPKVRPGVKFMRDAPEVVFRGEAKVWPLDPLVIASLGERINAGAASQKCARVSHGVGLKAPFRHIVLHLCTCKLGRRDRSTRSEVGAGRA